MAQPIPGSWILASVLTQSFRLFLRPILDSGIFRQYLPETFLSENHKVRLHSLQPIFVWKCLRPCNSLGYSGIFRNGLRDVWLQGGGNRSPRRCVGVLRRFRMAVFGGRERRSVSEIRFRRSSVWNLFRKNIGLRQNSFVLGHRSHVSPGFRGWNAGIKFRSWALAKGKDTDVGWSFRLPKMEPCGDCMGARKTFCSEMLDGSTVESLEERGICQGCDDCAMVLCKIWWAKKEVWMPDDLRGMDKDLGAMGGFSGGEDWRTY